MKRSLRREAQSGKRANGEQLDSLVRSAESAGRPAGNAVENDFKDMIERCSGKSESELFDELKTLTAEQRANGSFDPSSVLRGAERIAPMLNDEQRRRLYEIIGRL